MNDEKKLPPCDPEVFEKGESIGLFPGLDKEDVERLCKGLSAVTGWRIDWSYFAGRPHIRALAPADQYPGLATAWFDPGYQEFITAQGREATLRIGDGDRLARYSVPLFTGAQAGEVVALRSSLLRAGEREHELRKELSQLRTALKFYADRDHYSTEDGSSWDSCSGEPANILWHESEPWFIEDGSIARAALTISAERGQPDCVTCNGEGAVGNILDTVPCPDCAAAPPVELDERKAFERAFVIQEGVFFSPDHKEYRPMNGRAIERTDAMDANLRLQGWQAHAAMSGFKPTVLSKCVLCDQLQADLTERDELIDALRQDMKGDYDLDAWLAFVEEAPQLRLDAGRYRWLRSRDLETISQGGVFAGLTPDNLVLNEETLDQAIDAAMTKPKCRHCGDTGQLMVGRSGQTEDGNAPIMEPCEDCDRGMPDLASRPEERGTPETEPCSGCGTPGWTGACNKCVPY